MREKFIIYYRKIGINNDHGRNSLEAQQNSVQQFLLNRDCEIIPPIFTEDKNGKDYNWPALHNAINHAKATRSQLLIAKLDKMSRSGSFLAVLHKNRPYFFCADMPNVNYLTIDELVEIQKQEKDAAKKNIKKSLDIKRTRN